MGTQMNCRYVDQEFIKLTHSAAHTFSQNTHFTAEISFTLLILFFQIEVVATSVVGKTSSSCDLSQMTLQCEVLEGLDNVTKGAEGEDVTLTVLIRASPRPVVIW